MRWMAAGTGKSTNSQTVTQHFAGRGHLGASLFFKRGDGDGDGGNVIKPFTTRALAAQLA
jgi:hypothetical protein